MNILKHQLNLVGMKMPHYHRILIIRILKKVRIFNIDSIFIYNLYLGDQQGEGPSVDVNALNSDGSSKALDPKKSTIGQRRAPQPKKVFSYLLR